MATGMGGGPFVGSMTRVVWRWIRRGIEEEFAAAGFDDLSPAHIAVFRNPSPEGMRPTELAEQMEITKQSLNEALGHLEARGYLVRDPDPEDHRSRRIRLTERGHDALALSWRAAARAERRVADLIGEHRFHALRGALVELVDALGPGAPSGRPGAREPVPQAAAGGAPARRRGSARRSGSSRRA